jgi:hypothetical protein
MGSQSAENCKASRDEKCQQPSQQTAKSLLTVECCRRNREMLNALFEERDSSTHAFQCGDVGITGHCDLIMLGEAGNCRREGSVLRQDL